MRRTRSFGLGEGVVFSHDDGGTYFGYGFVEGASYHLSGEGSLAATIWEDGFGDPHGLLAINGGVTVQVFPPPGLFSGYAGPGLGFQLNSYVSATGIRNNLSFGTTYGASDGVTAGPYVPNAY